ncbi:MAG: AraC family transcriptional regulator [Woeseiaceae bacterium]|nr:AraC family transcriptional regulator [Woeseiaceae bacterium]
MNPIADIVRSLQLTGGVFLDAEFTAPWCVSSKIGPEDCVGVDSPPRSIIALHFVRSGRLLVGVDGEAPVPAGQGDIVALPRNDDHYLGSELALPHTDAGELIRPGADGRMGRITHGGGGDRTEIVCGFLGSDQRIDPVLVMLPKVLKLEAVDDASREWISSSFRLAAQESTADVSHASNVLVKIAEALFVDAVGRYLETLSVQESGWCAGMRDPKIAAALGLMHADLSKHWTADDLATQVGLSRSAFARRFTDLVGQPPIRYLSQQRLHRASRHLQRSGEPLARIAYACGYESESAFNRAFKREFGEPPAAWRDRHAR